MESTWVKIFRTRYEKKSLDSAFEQLQGELNRWLSLVAEGDGVVKKGASVCPANIHFTVIPEMQVMVMTVSYTCSKDLTAV